MSKKTFEFPRVTLQEKNVLCDFFFDEKDALFNFFFNFLDVYVVQNKVLRLSKSFFRETLSIKEITFEPSFEYQSYKFTAQLHLTRKELFLIKKI